MSLRLARYAAFFMATRRVLIVSDRWAEPILMPLTGKMDFSEPLETPRPARALLSLGYLYPVLGRLFRGTFSLLPPG